MLKYLNMNALEGNIGVLIEANKQLRPKNTLNIIKLSKDPRVESYMKGKITACEEVGIGCQVHAPKDRAELELLLSILQKDTTQKIIVQTPIDEDIFGDVYNISKLVKLEQDVDGFEFPLIKFRELRTIPQFLNEPCFSPTAKGVLAMMYAARKEKGLDATNLRGETITVIGTGLTSGLPIANACMSLGATVYTACSSTPLEDLYAMVGDSTIVVGCSGIPHIVNKEIHSKRDKAVYINVGMNRVNGKMQGDICQDDVLELQNTLYANPTFKSTGRLTCLFCAYNTVL